MEPQLLQIFQLYTQHEPFLQPSQKQEQGWPGVIAKILNAQIPFPSSNPLPLWVLTALDSAIS